MHVVYLTKDLFFSSRVSDLAREQGASIDVVPSVDGYEANGEATIAILDLNLVAPNINDVVSKLRQLFQRLRIIAYGPHVDAELLAAAEQAGCDLVLPRSQFNQQIAAILRDAASAE